MMTKAYSIAFKQKMVERLTGKNAVNPSELGREIGIRPQNLSRWLHEARSLPAVASNSPKARVWTVEQRAQALACASKLNGEQLTSYLEREGIKLADFERWRIALEEDGQGSVATSKRIRKLERELARKEKALAEVLLVLKKRSTATTRKRTTTPTSRARSHLERDRSGASRWRAVSKGLPNRRHLGPHDRA